jgi:hypothetical protein
MEFLKVKTSQTRDSTMMEDMFHVMGTSQQSYNQCQSQTKRRKA